jgi:hypothetical protein
MMLRSNNGSDVNEQRILANCQFVTHSKDVYLSDLSKKAELYDNNYDIHSSDSSTRSSSLESTLSLSLEDEFINKVKITEKPRAVEKMISQLIKDEIKNPNMYRKGATISIFENDLLDSSCDIENSSPTTQIK